MKKIFKCVLASIMFLLIVLSAPVCLRQTANAAAVRRVIDLEFEQAENKKEDEFSFRVYINKNEGINSLKMELSYDSEAMMLASYTKGSTLEKLDLETPEDDEPEGYAYTPFTFDYSSEDKSLNDNSTGVLLLMRFKLREGAANKTYKVTFINYEAKYYDDTSLSLEKCNVKSDEIKVNVVDGKVVNVEIGDRVEKNNSSNLWIILISIIGGLCIVLVGTILFVYLFKHRDMFQRKAEQRRIKRIKRALNNNEAVDYKSLNRSTKTKKKTKNGRIKKK